jgi:lipopolysaccharide export system protein LptC
MTAEAFAIMPEPARRVDFGRWRRRSLLIRRLRVLLPALIGLILGVMVSYTVYHGIRGAQTRPVDDSIAPIRLVNPRFMGRDDKSRAFVLTAVSAVRDQKDYQRVILDRPVLVLDERGPDSLRISARSGVYHETNRKLQLEGGVKLTGPKAAFETAASLFDTKTGELVGSGPIQGSGSLGQITAKSYGVFDKGDRMIFKGRVRARIEKQ